MRKVMLYLCLILLIGCSLVLGYSLKKCDCGNLEKTDEEIKKENYDKLGSKLFEYLNDMYNNDIWMNGGLEPETYKITLKEFESKGYDISMFINPITGNQCDLENTYGAFIVIGTKDDGKTDYTFNMGLSCE